MCLIEWFLGVLFCVLTVGISPTKSMSTKNPKLGKIMLQYTYVHMYIFSVYSSSLTYIYLQFSELKERCEDKDIRNI